ncbi:Hpt domain-containing protein [Janthinobacterium sp. 17J80-10]|uniref:Hpt domain-containing protein n=1 Tax=Janthinobacterium sp. 17J80-10 TaxID=2497863 RepID=UPI001005314F|nr:Hpt domain-containing protein [Janthinobacterium sp. 17J80-10]QAU35273.1 Hpt domain-containing protein [Janthinobacterium sp. 17J80-10]
METRMQEPDELEAMRDMFGADFSMLAELYLRDSPPRIAALQAAAAANDADSAKKIVHSLGGSCASIGASLLANLCQALELRCRAGTPGNLEVQSREIAAEYASIDARLRSMLQA